MDIPLEDLERYLAQARDALHNKMIEKGVRFTGYEGRTVSFVVTSTEALLTYIRELEAKIRMKKGAPARRRTFGIGLNR